MSAVLHVNLDSDKFSVLGSNWRLRLKFFSLIPHGSLVLDAEIEEDGLTVPVELYCEHSLDGTLTCYGQYTSDAHSPR